MGNYIVSIIIAIIIFSIVILFHELGHFSLAKANGIRVNEFCLGLGPTIFGIQKGETKYSLKLFPFGGACMMEGEDEDSDDERAFGKKSVWARMSVVFAGPFFNFIMAFVFAFILISCIGFDKPVLRDVSVGSAAEEAGLKMGDEIVRINNLNIHFAREIANYSMFHASAMEKPVTITYVRDGQKNTTELTPKMDEQTGKYVFGITYSIQQREKGNVLTNLKYSAYEVRYWIYSTVQSLKLLVTRQLSVNDLNGPVGIVKNMGDTYQKSVTTDGIGYAFLNMLNWAILLAANLGVMNLLPFPALDGGRLVFLVVEAIRRKKANQKVEGVINMIGLGLLFLLMFFVMFNDIRKLL